MYGNQERHSKERLNLQQVKVKNNNNKYFPESGSKVNFGGLGENSFSGVVKVKFRRLLYFNFPAPGLWRVVEVCGDVCSSFRINNGTGPNIFIFKIE